MGNLIFLGYSDEGKAVEEDKAHCLFLNLAEAAFSSACLDRLLVSALLVSLVSAGIVSCSTCGSPNLSSPF